MSARANLVINDRAATPVAHTYSPDGSKDGVHLWSEKTSVPAGNPRFTARLTQSNGKYRVSFRLTVPVVQTQTINGVSAPVVVRQSNAFCDFTFDSLSSDQERKDTVGLLANALAASQTQLNDMLVNLSDVY